MADDNNTVDFESQQIQQDAANNNNQMMIEDPNDASSEDMGNTAFPLPVGDVTCWKLVDSPKSFFVMNWNWLKHNKSQILSGITVALAQVPEAVSFSFVAGVPPIVGLQSAWIMGICTSLFGGRPGMVAGSTGAIAIVLPTLVKDHGIGMMFYAIMLAGLIQIAFGLCRLGGVVRLIPHPVMVGFCNGLGIVIGVAQFNIFKVRPEDDLDGGRRHLLEVGGAFSPFTNGYPWVTAKMGLLMTVHIIVALLTYAFFPKLTKAIPASLAAIIATTILEWALLRNINADTTTVEDLASVAGNFPIPVWVDTRNGSDYKDLMPPLNWSTFGTILPVSITAAAIGLLESLLTLEIIDELTNTKGDGNREAFGQGLGQFLSGMLGGMGGCTTIGQSLMNIHSGGYTRLSSSVAACFMLIIILAAYPLINLIPVAGLAGVMFVVTYFTIEWESVMVVFASLLPMKYRKKWGLHSKVKRTDILIMLTVVGVTLALDLAIAVGVGVLLSCLVYAWDSGTTLKCNREVSEDGTKVVYAISGPLFFGSIKPFMDFFVDPKSDPKDVTVLLKDADIHDWSGMMAIKRLHDRYDNDKVQATIKFEKLSVTSDRLMTKGKDIWEGVNVYTEETIDVENDPLVENDHYIKND